MLLRLFSAIRGYEKWQEVTLSLEHSFYPYAELLLGSKGFNQLRFGMCDSDTTVTMAKITPDQELLRLDEIWRCAKDLRNVVGGCSWFLNRNFGELFINKGDEETIIYVDRKCVKINNLWLTEYILQGVFPSQKVSIKFRGSGGSLLPWRRHGAPGSHGCNSRVWRGYTGGAGKHPWRKP